MALHTDPDLRKYNNQAEIANCPDCHVFMLPLQGYEMHKSSESPTVGAEPWEFFLWGWWAYVSNYVYDLSTYEKRKRKRKRQMAEQQSSSAACCLSSPTAWCAPAASTSPGGPSPQRPLRAHRRSSKYFPTSTWRSVRAHQDARGNSFISLCAKNPMSDVQIDQTSIQKAHRPLRRRDVVA
jgi:hypothetical protein